MVRQPRVSVAAVLAVLTACQPHSVPGLTEADRSALRAATDAQGKALIAADWPRFVATFTPDVVRMPPEQPIVQGRDVVLQWLKSFPPISEDRNTIDAIEGNHDVAYLRGRNVITLQVNGKPTQVRFKWLGVYRRQRDGSW